jgi:N-acetylneuraminic acid mutarotase
MTRIIFCALAFLLPVFSYAQDTAKTNSGTGWHIIEANGTPKKREDCSFVEVNGLFYLAGGRGVKSVDVFNPGKNTWTQKGNTPIELNHFQAVAYKNYIYVVGAMNGKYPHEIPLENIYIYNTFTDEWKTGPAMPAGRLRGSGGTVVYKNKIYLVCGIQDGHYNKTVTWMDEFDPETGNWRALQDAPHPRNHFNAAIVGNKLYLAGGRQTFFKDGHVVQGDVPEVDVFDFKKQKWETLPADKNLPTQRAGCAAVQYKNMLVIIGGESGVQKVSHQDADAYDPKKMTWKKLPMLVTGRHDTGALTYKNKIYIAAGSANRGGGPDQDTIEEFDQ